MDYFIGLDAHSQSCTFAVITKNGDLLKVDQIDTHEKKIISYLAKIKGKVTLVFEESFMSKWLYATLLPHVYKVFVCNPLFVTRRRNSKTDKIDAINLAKELRSGNLVEVFHKEYDELYDLRLVISQYSKLVRQIIQTKNRLKMIYRMEGASPKGTEVYKNVELLNTLKNQNSRFVGKLLFDEVQFLSDQKKQYRKSLDEYSKNNELIFCLTSIPCIDSVRACTIAALVCDPKRFKTKHHFWSYCGLVRHPQISDGVIYANKKGYGRSELKGVFYATATQIRAHYKSSVLFKHYQEQLTRGNNKYAARLSQARKIASIALSVMKNKQLYKYEEKGQSRRWRTKCKHFEANIGRS